MHLLLICEEEKQSKIVGKIKAVSSRKCKTRGHVPLSEGVSSPEDSSPQRVVPSSESIPLSDTDPETRTKKKYNALWTQKIGKSEIKTENT